MGDDITYWERHVSKKDKRKVANALRGRDLTTQIDLSVQLADYGLQKRIEAAKQKCAERKQKRARFRQNTVVLLILAVFGAMQQPDNSPVLPQQDLPTS